MHFCSFVGDQCLTLSYRKTSNEEETPITLTLYNKSDASQMWETKNNYFTEIRHHVEANMCLTFEDPTAAEYPMKIRN